MKRNDCLRCVRWVSENNPDNVHVIMADCGFTSAYDIWKHVAEKNLHLHYGLYAAAADNLCKKKIKVGARECFTVDALRNCKVPVLFIHGTDDAFVPVRMTYDNYKACAGPKHLLIVPGADHAMSYCVDKDTYQKEAKRFGKCMTQDV